MIDNILGNKTCMRALRLLSRSLNKFFTIKEIQENTSLGFGNLFQAIKTLEYHDLIIRKDSKVKKYKLNYQNSLNNQLIKLFEEENKIFQNIDLSLLKILADFESEIIKTINVEKIILFGSVARGTYDDKSDIDLAIINKTNTRTNKLKLTGIAKKYPREIQLHFFTIKEFNESKEPLIKNIKKEGVFLKKIMNGVEE